MAIKINGSTVIDDSQNFTSTGTISATGNITGGNVSVVGSITAAGVNTGSSPISTTGNVTGGNVLTGGLVSATGNVTGNYLLGNAYFVTGLSPTQIYNGTSNVSVTGSGANVAVAVGGTPNVAVYATTGQYVTGVVSANGTVTGGNLATGGTVSATGTATVGNVATGGTVSATGNATVGNVLTGGLISSTGNITSGATVNTVNLSVSGNVLGALLPAANVTYNLGSPTQRWNTLYLAGNTIDLGPQTISANASGVSMGSGNLTGSNITTGGFVSATGNVTGGNLVSATVNNPTAMTISTDAGNINLQPTSNIVINSKYINGVADPVQNQDVATKAYVDLQVSSALTFHPAVVATTTTTLATTTGGTVTYTQPNGVSNGVGAYLQTTGSFNLIDTANVQTVGTRILVKNEANAVWNGIYTWANATNIVRSTDTDEFGPDSSEQLSLNDYFFTDGGNVNKGSAYVVNSPSGTITFGSSNITFAQFSSAQIYSGNASAGISLVGTVINAKVDGVTTAFDGGGSISVKAGATLTTPNIGAATGTSLSTTGTITGGNLATGGTASATGTITGGNLATGGTASATGTITGGNILTAGQVSATGNITGSYLNGNGAFITGLPAGYSNTTAASFLAAFGSNTISTTGTITGGNITGANLITAGTLTVNSGGAVSAIINGGSNGSGNIGSSTTTFNTVFAKATTAQYADLAEKYSADAEYAPGTVLVFGGTAEVTVNAEDADPKVAGVVSTDPGFLMNEGLATEFTAAVALTGRVPTMILGPVKKGDMMVAAGLGRARAEADPRVGSVIGKALEDFDGAEGTIEVVVGRF